VNAPAERKKLRVLAIVHPDLVPPAEGERDDTALWKMEYDVVHTLRELGHEVLVVGVGDELGVIRKAVADFAPHIVFNLVEGFDEIATFDFNIVAYLELLKVKYTGCNARGLMIGRDKSLAKKLLSYHRVPVPHFAMVPKGRRLKAGKKLGFPLIVKSLNLDASIGISQASVVEDDDKLQERIRFIHESLGTDALVEQFVDGRELYVGVIGNHRLETLPIWELLFANMPEASWKIATSRLKWSAAYQEKHGIASDEATDLPEELAKRIRDLCKRVYRTLMLSGYARIDLRLSESGAISVIEANPNPQLARDEEFAESAATGGIPYPELIQRIVNLGLRWEPARWG
jgi:D-alanine-D-alanine ligase